MTTIKNVTKEKKEKAQKLRFHSTNKIKKQQQRCKKRKEKNPKNLQNKPKHKNNKCFS